MERDSKKSGREESLEYGPETIEERMRERVRDCIELIVEESWNTHWARRRGSALAQRAAAIATAIARDS